MTVEGQVDRSQKETIIVRIFESNDCFFSRIQDVTKDLLFKFFVVELERFVLKIVNKFTSKFDV